MRRSISRVRVRYLEVDPMRVAHHSCYLAWFEVGRTELMRELGCTYRQMESEGVFLPVVEVSCRYRSPARYDDLLEIETVLLEVAASRVTFEYCLRRAEGDALLAEGRTVHATVDSRGGVIRLPDSYRSLLARQ